VVATQKKPPDSATLVVPTGRYLGAVGTRLERGCSQPGIGLKKRVAGTANGRQ
jgi:hypothetical protein